MTRFIDSGIDELDAESIADDIERAERYDEEARRLWLNGLRLTSIRWTAIADGRRASARRTGLARAARAAMRAAAA